MEALKTTLEDMKSWCFHQQDRYWNLVDQLTPNETPVDLLYTDYTDYTMCIVLKTKESFEIKIALQNSIFRTHFNGYVKLPREMHPDVIRWLNENFEEFENNLNMEITYHDAERNVFGWDHGHFNDACLIKPLPQDRSHEPDKYISGPVQVLEEARDFIKKVLYRENEIMCRKKQEEMRMIEEELMAKAVSPERVEKWLNEDFEMFP